MAYVLKHESPVLYILFSYNTTTDEIALEDMKPICELY